MDAILLYQEAQGLSESCWPEHNLLFRYTSSSGEHGVIITITMAQPTEGDRASIIHCPPSPKIVPETFGDLLRRQSLQNGSRLLVYADHQARGLTFADAHHRSDGLAYGLSEMGIGKGDAVAVLMGNVVEYVELFFACAKIGALFTLANYGYSEGELQSVLRHCGAKALVMVARVGKNDYRDWVTRLRGAIPSLKHVVLVDAGGGSVAVPDDVVTSYESVVARGLRRISTSPGSLMPSVEPDDTLNLQFTSGSTGRPKAATLTHSNIYHAATLIGETIGLAPSDAVCLPVPLFHSFGLIIGLATVACWGASIILPSEMFDVAATLGSVARHRCTGIYGVTTMFVAEMAHANFRQYDMSSLNFAVIAGSAAPENLVRRIWDRFGISQTYSNWGLTESASICTMTRRGDSVEKLVHSSGSPFPGTSVKVVDPHTDRAVAWGRRGEIVLRGPQIQKGYYKDEIKTREAHKPSPEDGLVWFHTGDEGYLDQDGYVCITGRIKDMIIRGGENISPLEIEERLVAHPRVVQAAVIGVPDERYGEQIAAFLESSDIDGGGSNPALSTLPSDEELKAWVKQTLAVFKQPRYFWWLGADVGGLFHTWPKTGSGKLRKPDLRIIAAKLMEGESTRKKKASKL